MERRRAREGRWEWAAAASVMEDEGRQLECAPLGAARRGPSPTLCAALCSARGCLGFRACASSVVCVVRACLGPVTAVVI